MNEDRNLSTFEIKMTILTIMGDAAEKNKAEELYQWVMQEVETATNDNVTQLTTVN